MDSISPKSFSRNSSDSKSQSPNKILTTQLFLSDIPIDRSSTFYEKLKNLYLKEGAHQFIMPKNKRTRKIKGFAKISFNKPNTAKEALNTINFKKIDGWEIIATEKVSNISEREKDTTLIVKNLPINTSSYDLKQLCDKFGKIRYCRVKTNKFGEFLHYGLVDFESKNSAEICIESLDKTINEGSELKVETFVPKEKRQSKPQDNLYIKNFPLDYTQAQVEDFIDEKFGAFGKIKSKRVVWSEDNQSYFAFCSFFDCEHAAAAKENLNSKEVEDELLYVGFKLSFKERAAKNRASYKKFPKFPNQYLPNITDGSQEALVHQSANILKEYLDIKKPDWKNKKWNKNGQNIIKLVIQNLKSDTEENKILDICEEFDEVEDFQSSLQKNHLGKDSFKFVIAYKDNGKSSEILKKIRRDERIRIALNEGCKPQNQIYLLLA